MIKEGALDNPKVDAVFGLHVFPYEVGDDALSAGCAHGELRPLRDRRARASDARRDCRGTASIPIVVASQIVLGLQTITSRQVDLTESPAVVTVGA